MQLLLMNGKTEGLSEAISDPFKPADGDKSISKTASAFEWLVGR